MHGRAVEPQKRRSISQHMHSLPLIPADSTSFFKDGRKICVGDCALFNPSNHSPPFIGLIRCLDLNKENNLQLGVNWLYRSSELKLGKGTLVDSAPNEIFYSFHKDVIPAASLLHPCKVAFLPRGVELPTGTPSFVCRRAYDIANKSLWWLTDQDYINDQQEEVDQLLYKTRTEMHMTLQSGGRSPKQATGPTSTSQLKTASDSGQNSGSSFPSHAKGKKRERGDHDVDPVKRERSSRLDDGDSVQCKIESNLKYEIARITEKGGLVDLEGVEKLIQLMQPDRTEKKLDMVSRLMLASVMASTDKDDCLNRFVQLRGLPLLDEWLQDIHKGRSGDGNNIKDGEKSVDDFLLVLLHALDKLPVNIQSLQMCNIGRSVNHLRSHKNIDIQRKARTLVDTWKKRVKAEMMSNDAKSGSTQTASAWTSKTRLPEASHGGSRTPSGSDVAMKSSITQNSAAKTTSCKSSPGESSTKNVTSSPGPVKPDSTVASGKENQSKTSVGGTADSPQIREDGSSSSNQSHNYCQSLSAKDDLKSTTSGLVTVNKISSSSTRNRKINGFPGTSAAGSQKETSSNKSSLAHNSTFLEKPHSALNSERVVDGPISEGSSHKLIVKIPNRVRSPAQGVSEGSLNDPVITSSRASSPVIFNKHEQSNHASKEKSDVSNDILTVSDGAGSPATLPDGEQSLTTEDSKRLTEGPPANQLRPVKLHVSSFSPMNALIESCVKYSEATSSLSLDDDVGMNLLASVAAGELSRSDVVSPSESIERSVPPTEDVCTGDEAKSKYFPENYPAESDGKKQAVFDGGSCLNDGLCLSKPAPLDFSGDRICAPSQSAEAIPAREDSEDFVSSSLNLRGNAEPKWEITEQSNDKAGLVSKAIRFSVVEDGERKSNGGIHEKRHTSSNVIAVCRSGGTDLKVTEEKDNTDRLSIGECKLMVDDAGSKPLDDCNKFEDEGLNKTSSSQPKLTAIVESEFSRSTRNGSVHQSECSKKLASEAVGSVKVEEPDYKDTKSIMIKSGKLNLDKQVDRNSAGESQSANISFSTSHDLNGDCKEAKLEKQEIVEHISPSESRCPASVANEAQEDELAGKSTSTGVGSASSSPSGEGDPCEKMKFDLNEDFSADDGKFGESVTLSTTVQMINSLPFSVNSIPSGHPASITVASAAKRNFVPPEDLLKIKGELGWKGSAATSAFRPAEPRKVVEMAPDPSNLSCSDASTSKHDRLPLDIDLNIDLNASGFYAESTADLASNCASLRNKALSSTPSRGSGGLDLDLNRVDEANDTAHCSTNSNHISETSTAHVKPLTSFHGHRDFDLNSGPVVDDASVEHIPINQLVKGGVASQLPSAGPTMNSDGPGSFSSWFSPGNTYSTVAVPSALPDRGEQPFPVFPPGGSQRTLGPVGVNQFNPDVYRGSVLSSSPALPFSSSPCQYPAFPFWTAFPLPSVGGTSYPDTSSGARLFPAVNSQYVGPVGNFASQFQRPYVVGHPNFSSNGRQGLDLNAGPGNAEREAKEEILPLTSGHHSVASLQALAEEQSRMFSVSGGILKRRDPEGGFDNEPFRHKHSSRQ